MATPTFSFGTSSASVGDLIAGSWNITEATPAIDILDSSGEVGGLSAAFKRNFQGTGNTPTSTPLPSSDYLQGQSCTMSHPTLGVYSSIVSNVKPSGGTVAIDGDSSLSSVNVEMAMPAYIEGATFYSWQRQLPTGTAIDGIQGMAVNSSGNIWVTGNISGSNASMLYDRFGNYIMGISHSNPGRSICLDSSGNIYVQTSLAVEKFNSAGTSLGVIITSGAGSFAKMAIDSSDNIYIATTDTTSNAAIKKYTNTGTFVSSFLTYNSGATVPAAGVVASYTGMTISPTSPLSGAVPTLLIGYTGANANVGHITYVVGCYSLTGTLQGTFAFPFQDKEFSNIGIDYTPLPTADGDSNGYKVILASQTGLSQINNTGFASSGITYTNTAIAPRANRTKPDANGTWNVNSYYGTPLPVQVLSYSPMAYAADKNGSGYWYGLGSTVYRVAGGYMGPNQAIECYLGAAGFRGTVQYGPGFTYADSASSLVNFPAWTGNVWSKLKELSSRVSRGINPTSSGVYIYHTDSRSDQISVDISNREQEPSISLGEIGAQVISVTSQNVVRGRAGRTVLYTAQPDDPVMQVGAGRVFRTTITIPGYATAIDPPLNFPISFSWPLVDGNQVSTYVITDSRADSFGGAQRVDPVAWTRAGGKLEAAPGTTAANSIDITLTGPQTEMAGYVGPYRVGYISGGTLGTFQTGLRLMGSGITVSPETFPVLTGVPVNAASDLTSQNLDSVFLDTISAAYDMARISAGIQSAGSLTLTVKIPITSTMQFGKMAGGYFFYARNMWRINRVEYSGGWADLSCTRDTRYGEAQPSGLTYAQGATLWNGFRYVDNYLSPGVNGA